MPHKDTESSDAILPRPVPSSLQEPAVAMPFRPLSVISVILGGSHGQAQANRAESLNFETLHAHRTLGLRITDGSGCSGLHTSEAMPEQRGSILEKTATMKHAG